MYLVATGRSFHPPFPYHHEHDSLAHIFHDLSLSTEEICRLSQGREIYTVGPSNPIQALSYAQAPLCSNLPGSRTLINSFGPLGFFFKKPIRGFARGSFRSWLRKHQDFEDCGMDIISAVIIFPGFVLRVDTQSAYRFLSCRILLLHCMSRMPLPSK